MYNSKISGLGYYVPENIVTNNDLSKIMQKQCGQCGKVCTNCG